MTYHEKLAARVRTALAHLPKVEEKPMFGGLAFLVDGKMCINISKDRLMCRIDPALHEEALNNKGTQTVMMRDKPYIGYVYVDEAVIQSKKELNYWIELSLDFNKHAKASAKKGKSPAGNAGLPAKKGKRTNK